MKKRIKTVCICTLVVIVLTNIIFNVIYISEVTRFESKLDSSKESSGFFTFSKSSLLSWSEEVNNFDVSGLEDDLKEIDDDQRLIVSFGREISFFYRIRPFEPVEVKYKNDKITNYVYVYKINYEGPIIDYTVY